MTLDKSFENPHLPAMQVFKFLCVAMLLFCGCGRGKDETKASLSGNECISTLAQFDEILAEHSKNLDESFCIQCSPELHSALMEASSACPETTIMDDIRQMNGSFSCSSLWKGDTLNLQDISYYEGWRILNSVRRGNEDRLNERELATLREAKALVANAHGHPYERERYIHDTLCNRIDYYTNDGPKEEKDCAIGALLNGKADCDGYADAMMLCCGLAGIPCRYMHGSAQKNEGFTELQTSKERGHLWNLVKIAGSWVSVDVTWGDQKKYISYLFYNLGRKDTSLAYRWDPRSLFVELAEETDSDNQLMPDLRRTVINSLADVYFIARQATSEKVHRFTFICHGAPPWKTAETEFFRLLGCGGWKNYSYLQSGRILEVERIEMDDNISFCDTEAEALNAISKCAVIGMRSFSLYFSPAFAEVLFADDCAGLKRLLSRSQIEPPHSLSYSLQAGSVSFKNISFTHALPVCNSEREIKSLLRNELVGRPTKLAFLLPDWFDFSTVKDLVFNCVRSMGVKVFSWSSFWNRITLLEIEYYDEFRIVKTKEEVSEYVRSASQSGKTVLRVFCPPDLYAQLRADNFHVFWEILGELGYRDCTFYHNDSTGMLLMELNGPR